MSENSFDAETLTLEAPTSERTDTDKLSERIFKLRDMYWQGAYLERVEKKKLMGSGDPSLVGRARDFAAWLDASSPVIQDRELLAGISPVIQEEGSTLDFGFYDRHYPPGHANILRLGFPGIRDRAREKLIGETDPKKKEFLRAVEISYDAACRFIERHSIYLRELAKQDDEIELERKQELLEIAHICHELSVGAPNSFHAALQAFWFTFMFGGRGCIGRFDQWMYPFYKRDIESGAISQDEAQELLESLWVKLNFFAGNNDSLRNVALAGQTPDGRSAANELSFMCLEASRKLMLPEPKLNCRFCDGTPRELLIECCRALRKGLSNPSIFNDNVTVPALTRLGIPIEEARDYCNDGCSELIMGGKGTISFRVYDQLPVLNEVVYQAVENPYPTFDDVMAAMKEKMKAFMPDGHGEDAAVTFPYFAASIDDCLEKASPTGVRYSIWGQIAAGLANTADGLAAIRKLIYEEKSLTWAELIAAMKADYEGYETLRQKILNNAPKFGNDDDYVDEIVKELTECFLDGVHERAKNVPGPGPKRAAGLMSFGIHGRKDIPASPDGRKVGEHCGNSFSPGLGRDKSGPTAVLKTISKVDMTKATHGSVLDMALHTAALRGENGLEKLVALVDTFLKLPCTATLQLNVIDRDTLVKARENPTDPQYRTLLVRVWGFSTVFVELIPDLQDHVIARTEHEM